MSNLVQKFQEYSEWRKGVVRALEQYRAWTNGSDMADTATDQRLARLMERLVDDKLSIAFVAEFSRGKSELINAIFLPITVSAFCLLLQGARRCVRQNYCMTTRFRHVSACCR
jgi:hypothetical protein